VTAALAAACLAAAAPGAAQAATNGFVRQVQVIEPESIGTDAPAGLAFSARGRAFQIVGRQPRGSTTAVIRFRPFLQRARANRRQARRLAVASRDPINAAFDDRRHRLLLLSRADRLVDVRTGRRGGLRPWTLVRRDAGRLDLRDPQGMTVDPARGTLFFLDARGPSIVRVQPGPRGGLARATVSRIDLGGARIGRVRGIAFDPSSGHLQVGGTRLYELTTRGRVVAVRDLSGLGVGAPQGMTFAPSGDLTDPPGQLSLYVAYRRGAGQATGGIVELSLTPLAAAATASATFTSSLVRTIDTAAFAPPSPDPSGLAYLPGTDRLLMVDGEVEETVKGITHFQGANVWEMTRRGSVTRTANISKIAPTTTPMTNEPTGVAFDPGSRTYFISDDGRKVIFRLDPGADALVGTADDRWTSFSTSVVGDNDPEGVAYDTARDRVFVADGVNAEVYQYTPAGSPVGHFDVLQYGVADPESVEYNPDTGTLFVLSNRQSGPIIAEVSTTGALLRTIDVRAAGARKPAGLAYAPASDGSGARSFYVADRAVDNNSDPFEVDGKIFELTAPGSAPPANRPPVITSDGGGATASRSVPENQTFAADVDATDPDGDQLTYAVAGGADQARFTINPATGVLTFVTAPDFEAPADVGADNVYNVTVSVSDGRGGTASQALAITVTDVPDGGGGGGAGTGPLQFSLASTATLGGVSVANEDLATFDGTSAFGLAFDGSDVGLGPLRVDAAAWLNATTLLLSFTADGVTLPGIAETVDDSDIVVFDATSLGSTTAGTFSMYFDASDVGLDPATAAHDVDALELLPDGRLLISTVGTLKVGGITASDEDLLAFTPTSLGTTTSGTFSMYFDGSDVGLGDTGEDLDGVAVDAQGRLLLSTSAAFAVPGLSGAAEDVFVFTPTALGQTTSGTYAPTLYFDGSAFGLAGNNVGDIELPFG
jgi:sugar lactone lactonase YvrE